MIKRYKNKSQRRAVRTRFKVRGTGKYRLTVFRSNKYIYAQVVDLARGDTLVGVSGKSPSEGGEKIAKKALKSGIGSIAFDRGSYRYHGQVKQLAEAARVAGLKF